MDFPPVDSEREHSGTDPEPPAGDILVVDDNPANLTAVEAALGDFEGRVVRAQSGAEALGQLLARDFAVVLLDVNMPSMDGLETARMIRARKRSRHTPIIFITAHGRDDSQVLEAYKLGAVDFLFKPLVAEILEAKVMVFVELQQRTAKIALQGELLRDHNRREAERTLEGERRRWESESLRLQMAELEEADRRKDEFLALLGHELRNPLTPIVTGIALLQGRLGAQQTPDTSALRTCEKMQRQATHLTRLVDDLLDVSRINSGKIALKRSPVSVQEVVEQALATSRPLIDKRGHEVILTLPPDPLVVLGDAVRLVQAVANLINNAARYTENGGRISVSTDAADGFVEVRVQDNGRGIDADFMPRIFDKFVQERDATGGGLGLGLTLAAQLVEMHGGVLSAASEGRGKGSVFTVRLPLGQPSAAERRSVLPPKGEVAAGRLVIALVDDQADIRELLQELLSDWGHSVEVASDGASGIELIKRLRPDVALVDIGLPDVDGYQVAGSVRAALGRNGVRLVAMTGFGRDTDRKLAKEAGFDAHLVKPIDMDSLKRVLSFEDAR